MQQGKVISQPFSIIMPLPAVMFVLLSKFVCSRRNQELNFVFKQDLLQRSAD